MDGSPLQSPVANSDLKGRIWTETKLVWSIILPSIVARITSFGLTLVTQIWIGHINKVELAAFGLTQSVLGLFSNGIILGMSSATDTFCGQAFGAQQYHMLGVYLQRSWIVNLVTATILVPLFVFSNLIFQALGEEKEVAAAAGQISLLYIPVLYSFALWLTSQMFLQAQLKNAIVGWISATAFLLDLLLCWILVGKLTLGVPGAMISLIVSSWASVAMAFTYIFGGWCAETWKGFTLAAFADLLPVIQLSISSGIMLCLELWYQALLVLIAGYLEDASVEISAFSLCMSLSTLEFMICLGFLTSACVRVANELGRGNAKAAIFSVKVTMSNSLILGILFWILFLIFGHDIPRLLTNDKGVQEAMSNLSVLLAFSFLFNSIQPVLTGVAVGAGLQGAVAIVNVGCYYLIGVPVGLLLGYVAKWGIKGLWMGLLSGIVAQTAVLAFLLWKTNWQEQIDKASKRLDRWLLEEPSTDNGEDPAPS